MAILIDGYNLMHAVGLLPRPLGPQTLQRLRRALLNSLMNRLRPEELGATTIVFDAKNAPADMPSTVDHHGITVRFARDHDEADDLIEELIRQDSAPRKLTVVSSDHRIRQAACRRKARAVDSETWYDQTHKPADRATDQRHTEARNRNPANYLSEAEVESWLEEFGLDEN